MISYRIFVDDLQVRRAFADWKTRLPKLNRLILDRCGNAIVGTTQQYFMSGQAIGVRTGRLRASMNYRQVDDFNGELGDLQAASNVRYAGIQERGGTVTPVRGRYLAIPIYRGAESTTMPKGPRDFRDLFFLRLHGKPFLARRAGGGARRLELMFALKTSVTIPPHWYLRNGIQFFISSGRAEDLAERTAMEFIANNWGN